MRCACFFGLLPLLVAGAPARAQSDAGAVIYGDGPLFRSDVAGVRVEPQFAPKRIEIGSLAFSPSLTVRLGANSNVFNRADAKDSDVTAVLAPSLRVETNWARHQLAFDSGAAITRFASLERENSEEYNLAVSGRYDLDERSSLAARAGYAQRIEPRGTGGLNRLDGEPSAYNEFVSGISARGVIGDLRLTSGFTFTRLRYDAISLVGGGRFDQTFRNSQIYATSFRGELPLRNALDLLLLARFSKTDAPGLLPALSRDSRGIALLAGFRTELTNLLVAEVSAGWRARRYTQPIFRDYDGAAYEVKVDWYPTPLMSFRISSGQDFENSGLIGAAGVLARATRLTAYYEPIRSARITVSVEHQRDRYIDLPVATRTVLCALRAEQRFNPRLSSAVFLSYRDRSTSNADLVGGYSGFAAGVSLIGNL